MSGGNVNWIFISLKLDGIPANVLRQVRVYLDGHPDRPLCGVRPDIPETLL
jgi:hypothetical protein